MIKKITHNNEIIALVFKKNPLEIKEGINFFTTPENSFQVGILNHPKGFNIPRHVHNKVERKIFETQEMLYVEQGKMKVIFVDENNNLITEEIFEPGELVLLMRQGHGFEFLEDSKVVYVKQGPYVDKSADKKVF